MSVTTSVDEAILEIMSNISSFPSPTISDTDDSIFIRFDKSERRECSFVSDSVENSLLKFKSKKTIVHKVIHTTTKIKVTPGRM
mmetsp:Transcript_12/g.34  ORF Transcript_12/g.34 Transcript_12/m.34 type:complete len:84 (+) Transcript_12:714-965(+)